MKTKFKSFLESEKFRPGKMHGHNEIMSQGETFEELLGNIYEAVEGCLSVDIKPFDPMDTKARILEIAV